MIPFPFYRTIDVKDYSYLVTNSFMFPSGCNQETNNVKQQTISDTTKC